MSEATSEQVEAIRNAALEGAAKLMQGGFRDGMTSYAPNKGAAKAIRALKRKARS